MSKIEHIFNQHNANKNKAFINSQEFKIDYIKDNKKGFESKKSSYITDFDKKYYEALVPSANSIISKYDDEKIDDLLSKLSEDILMISGDFWGIQKFIFNGLTSKKASKILRSRSAIVQLFTYVVVDIIKKEFKNSDAVLFGAGKFMILASKEEDYESKIKNIQEKIDSYFLDKYFGQNGLILSYSLTSRENISNQESSQMKEDLLKLAKDNELRKLRKFDIKNLNFEKLVSKHLVEDNEGVCQYCNKRTITNKDEECCSICHNEILLGTFLTKYQYIEILKEKKSNAIKIFDSYFVNFSNTKPISFENSFDISSKKYEDIPKWSLGSYIPRFENSDIKTFEELAKNSSGLIALKADIDKLGDTFRDYYMTSFKKFNRLSREIDFFFSDYATHIIEEEFKNCYIIFAGGDDLFLIGEYKEVVSFAKRLREEFYRFSLQKVTISMGLVMFKSSTPINYISRLTDEAEARAKSILDNNQKDRDGIDIFSIPMKFVEFFDIESRFKEISDYLESKNIDTTTFYYRLLDFCDMKKNILKDVKNAMWKSKLRYIITRNIKPDDSFNIYEKLHSLIEKYDEKFKPSIFLKIYLNRDKKGEKR